MNELGADGFYPESIADDSVEQISEPLSAEARAREELAKLHRATNDAELRAAMGELGDLMSFHSADLPVDLKVEIVGMFDMLYMQ